MKYFSQIDALRAISVFIVIFHHLPIMDGDNLFTQYFHHFTGVDIFFVISGFLITRILLVNKENDKSIGQNLKTFYIRRFFRIFPIYYASIAYLVVINPGDYRSYFVNDLLYISNFKMGFAGEFASVTPHFWSLAVEEQFYLFWPLLVFFVPRNMNYLLKSIIAICLVGLVGRYAFNSQGWEFLAARTINCLVFLAGGGILAYLNIYYQNHFKKTVQLWPFALVFILIYPIVEFYGDWHMDMDYHFPLHALISIILVAKFVDGFKGIPQKVFEWQAIVFLGKISYGLYVYHFLAIHFMTPMNKLLSNVGLEIPLAGYEGAVYKILVTVLIATVSWYVFEKPINKLKNKFAY